MVSKIMHDISIVLYWYTLAVFGDLLEVNTIITRWF